VSERSGSGRPLLGASALDGGVRFAAFTRGKTCSVQLVGPLDQELAVHALSSNGDGYFEGFFPDVQPSALYYFVVDGRRLPDPYARFLPQGVHGPARVVAPSHVFRHPAPQRPLAQQVIYELHVGTFTEAGTYRAELERLPALAELGITTLELMPIAAFSGERGWGYDGVALFAPHAPYGTPDELAAFVDAAHALGLSVLLDVVYNHFGPSGNYLAAYSPSYFCEDVHNAWGNQPNFEDPALRELVLENARYWLVEFGFDGLRLDATHAIVDPSPRHILRELAELAHGLEPQRLVIAEDERNLSELVTEIGLDAVWADDFHHQGRVTLTREQHGYYGAFEPGAAGIARAIARGWIYEGQHHPAKGEPRGTKADALCAEQLVYCIQNHDQIGNRAFGDRLSASVGIDAYRALSLLLLFLPMTPLLFMGQEWAATTPFLYFTDHDPELGRLVSEGRRREFAASPELQDPEKREQIPDPQAEETFLRSRLNWLERDVGEHRGVLELYREALLLRRTDPVLRDSGRESLSAEAVGDVLVVQRALGNECRVLLVNFGADEVRLETLVARLRLREVRPLLHSVPGPSGALAKSQAIVLAARSAEPAQPE
jgi:maltooligosyltrehalose trehalohydrolase